MVRKPIYLLIFLISFSFFFLFQNFTKPTSNLTRSTNLDSRCPVGWICPVIQILNPDTKIGIWYSVIWQKPGSDAAKGGTHWEHESRYRPLLGYYDSGDSSIITSHIEQIHSAGIDYLLIDHTNGIGNDSGEIEKNAQSVFSTAEKIQGHFPVSLAVAIGCGLWCEGRSVQLQETEAQWILDYYSKKDIYYKWKNKPLMVVYNSFDQPNTFAPEWDDSRFTVRKAAGFINQSNPLLAPWGQFGYWGWVQNYPQYINGETMGVNPGWDTEHLGRKTTPLARSKGSYYSAQWLHVLKHRPQNIIISSWNDFGEETAIEPSVAVKGSPWNDSYGNETSDFYLQMTIAYSKLRIGLIHGYYYKDENDNHVYRVFNGKLFLQGVMPRLKPVIVLPADTLKKLQN